ncbi:hypothetical protein J7E87_13265 [Streptomyces sp. ISL-1]|uniref:hypothetical protein n=1 Tax=Streptomyces sp. ISL-1 TaxID=2817657 RepID=UPI001BE605EE|nr:hypothetical protein [Streptomyces sp. ISL-1]MBT2390370.1 hypothetical protein [Streptomyces sp. ISL-1]
MSPAEAALWEAEYNALSARWEALRVEGDGVLVRQRLRRVEALMSALLGNAAALG